MSCAYEVTVAIQVHHQVHRLVCSFWVMKGLSEQRGIVWIAKWGLWMVRQMWIVLHLVQTTLAVFFFA